MNINTNLEKKKSYIFTPKKNIKVITDKMERIKEVKDITKRLYLQTYRRPSSLAISILQPLLWLTLFGALFQYAPIYLFESLNIQYREFLNPGIIVFTSFNTSINAGLPIIFDREFGFLNRILTSPITNKNSIIYSCIIHTWTITVFQILILIFTTSFNRNNYETLSIFKTTIIVCIITITITSISNISIFSAFILPGHIEFIAITNLLLNLPTLFASTALAPLSFMPTWLQLICCINPLTYAIEIIRNITLNIEFGLNTLVINTSLLVINLKEAIVLLTILNITNFLIVRRVIKYKYD